MNEKLLREYVRVVLTEDEYGGGYGDLMYAGAGMSPFGVSFGSGDDLSKIFIKPFTDVIDTALGKSKEITTKVLNLAHVALVGAITSIIPTLKSDYAAIFEKQHKEIDKIRKEFAPVYQLNWNALRDNDVLGVAFCYDPVALITAKFVSRSPRAACSLVSSLSGGRLDHWRDRVREKYQVTEPKTGLGADFKSPHTFDSENMGGGVGMEVRQRSGRMVLEDDKGKGKPKKTLTDVLTNEKVKRELESSSIVKEMEQRARALVRGTLKEVFAQAQGVLSSHSLEEIQRKTGVKFADAQAALAKVPQAERAKTEQAILSATRQSIKEFYEKNIEGLIKQAQAAGVPDDSDYVADHRRVLAKIKAL